MWKEHVLLYKPEQRPNRRDKYDQYLFNITHQRDNDMGFSIFHDKIRFCKCVRFLYQTFDLSQELAVL